MAPTARMLMKSTALGNSRHGGALFTLSRELRDEIYRLLAKKRYNIYITRCKPSYDTQKKSDLAMLEVSRAISHEASSILYSEAIFGFAVDFSAHDNMLLSSRITKRMRNVELDLTGILPSLLSPPPSFSTTYTYQKQYNTIFQSAITDLLGADIARNSLRIRLICRHAIIKPFFADILERAKGPMRVRKLILEVVPIHAAFEEVKWQRDLQRWGWSLCEDQAVQRRQDIKHMLEPTLGHAAEEYEEYVQHFTLHPGQHAIKSTKEDGRFETS